MKVLKFYADWCGPCKSLTRVLEGVHVNTPIEPINIDDQTEIAAKYAIRGVPTCVLVDDTGKEVGRRVGMMNEQQFRDFIGE